MDHLDALALHVGRAYRGSANKDPVYGDPPGPPPRSKMQLPYGTHWTDDLEYAKGYTGKQGAVHHAALTMRQPLDLTKGFWWRGEPGFEQALALSQALGKKAAYGITYTNPETLKRMSEPQGVGINTSMLDKAGAKRAYSALLSAGYDGIVYEPRHGGPVTPGAHQMNPDVQWGSMTLTNRKAPRSYVSLTRDGFELIPPIDSPDSPTNDIAEDQPPLMRRLEETAPLDELAREQASQDSAEHPILARLSPAERAMLGQPLSKKSSRRYPTAEEYPIVRDWLVGNSQKMQPYLTPDMTAYTPGETLWLLDQPAYKAWHEYAANFKVPEGYSTVVFVPCAKTKPWDKATSDRASKTLYKSYNAIREQVAAGELPPVYFATISEPLGIVPENNWGDFITRSPYDNPGLFRDPVMRAGGAHTKDWLEKFGKVTPTPFDKEAYGVAIDRLSDVIAAFMKNNSHLQYLAFVDDPNPRKPTTHGDMVRAANQKVGGLIDEANIFSKKPLPPKNVSAHAITPQNFMTDKIKQLVSWAKDAPDAVVSPEMDDPMPGSDVAEEMAMRQDSANAAGDSTDTLFQGGPRRPKAASAAADANVDLTGKSFTPEHIAEAFGIPDHQARAVHFLAKSMGLNMRRLRVAVGDDADMAVYEGEKSQTGFDQEYLNRRLRETSLVSLNDAAQLLGPKAPEYLNAVVEFMKSQRQKAIAGEFLPSDVAKAYLLTLGSMHSSENNLAQIEKKTGLKFPPEYVTYNKNGVPMIRPEEAVAYWFTTEEGKAALDAVNRGDYRTDYDADLFKGLNKLRDIFGTNDIRNNALGIKRGVYTEAKNPGVTMKGIRALTDRINAAQGDVGVISAALTELTGIGSAKVGFIKHLLGFGDTATADAVEINYWLTGQGDVSQLNTRQAELARDLKAKGSGNPVTQAHLQRLVQARLEGLYDLLGLGEGPNPISRDFAIHFLHHWLWDKAKQTETTHRGSMGAVADHINPTFAQSVMNRNARVIKGLTRFVNAKKAIMKGFAQADLGTAIHELSHAARRLLFDRSIPAEMRLGITDEDIKAVEDWCGVAEDGIWHRDAEEAFANANEQYFKSGFEIDKEGNVANPRSLSASVQKVIANIVNWLKDMYVRITRTGKEEKYNPSPKGVSAPVRQAFDNLYTRNDRLRKQGYTEKQIQNMRFVDSRSQDPDGTPPRLYEEGDMPNDASKKSTPEESSGDSNFRCTEATLRALGIEGHTPKSGMGVIQALQDAGQKPVPVDLEGMKGARTTTTRSGPSTSVGLADFIREHPTGRYYLASAGHAMALIDGVLTDTSGRKVSNNLRIWGAMKLSDPVSEPSVAQAPKKTYRIGAYGTGPEGKNRAVILDWVGAKNPEITEFPVRELDARNPVTLVFEAENDSEARRFLEENLLPDDKRPLYLTKDMAKTFRLDPKAATTPQEYEPFQIKSNGRLPSKASRLWVGLIDQLSDTDEELQKAIADHNAASPEERPAMEKQVQRLSRTAEGIMDMMETFRSDVENQTDGLMDDMSDAAADRYETWRDQWTDPLEWEGLTKDQDGNYAHDAGDVLASARYLDHGPENAQGEVPEWPEEGLSNPYKPVSDKAETPSEEKPPQNSATTAPQEPDQWNNRREIPLDTPLARANDGTEFRIVRKGLGGKTPRYSYSVEINSPSLGKKGWTTPNDFFKGFDTPEKAASFILDPKRAQSRLLDLLDPDNESVSKEIPSAIHPSMLLRSPLGGKVLSSSEWDWRPEIVEKSLQDAARMVEERWPGSVTVPLDWAQKHLGFMDDHEWSDFTGRMTANGVVGTMKDTKPYQMVLKGRSSVSAQDPGQSNTTPGEPGETTSQRESGSALETSRRRGPRITEVPGRYIRPPSLPKKVTRWNTDAASGVMEATVPFEDAKLEFRIRPIAGTYDIHVSMPENFEGMTSDYFRARTKAEAKTKVNEWLERYRPSAFIIQPDAESVYYPPEISYDSRAARRRARELSLHLLDKGVALPDTNVSVFRSNEWRSGDGGWVDTKGNFVGYDLQFSPDAEPEYTYNTMLDYPLERQKIVRGEPNPNYRDDAESQPTLEDRIKAAKERNKTQTPQNSVSQEAVDNATLDERGTGDQTSQTSPEEAASMTWERSERIRGKRPVVIHVSGPDNAGRKFVVSSVVRPKNLSTDFETPAAGYEVRIEHPENSSKPPQALGPFRTVAEAKAAAEKWSQENPATPVPSDEQVTNAALESIVTGDATSEVASSQEPVSSAPRDYESAIEAVKTAPSARRGFEPDFRSESLALDKSIPREGEPNSLSKPVIKQKKGNTVGRPRKATTYARTILEIGAYGPDGKLVGTFSGIVEGTDAGAFKISVDPNAQRQGVGSRLLDAADANGFDLVENAGKNSYTYQGRGLVKNWLQKRKDSSETPTQDPVNRALESVATNETPTETTGNDTTTDRALADIAGEEVPDAVSYDTLIKKARVVANSVTELQPLEVARVLDSAPKDLREGLAQYIRENRPDLSDAVEDWILDTLPEEPRPVPKAPSYELGEHPSGIPTDGRVIGTFDGEYNLAITVDNDGAYRLLRAPIGLSEPTPSDWEEVQTSYNGPEDLLEKFAHYNSGIKGPVIKEITDPAVKAWLEENKDRIDTDISQGRGPELYSDVENTSGMRALRETLRGLSDEQIDALRKATRGIARETTVEGTRQFRNKLLTDNNIVDAMNEALEPFGLSLDDVNPNDDYYTDHQKVDVMARQIQREFLARRGYTNPDQRTLDLDTPLPESERYFSPEARAERAGQDPVERALDALATGDQVPTETGNDTATDTAIREMADGVNNLGAGDTTQTPGETTAPTSDSEIESVKEPWQQTKQEYVQERYPYAREVELRDAVRKLEAKEKRLWSDFNKRENHPQRSWVPPPIHHEIQGKTEKAIAATEADLARARAELSSYLTGKGSAEQEYYQRVKQAISEGKPVSVEVLTASMGGADVAELAAIWDISEEEMAKLLEGPAGSSSGNVPQVSTPGETTTSPPESIPLDKPLFSLETPNGARYDFKIQQLPDGQHAMEVRQRNRVEDPKTGEEVWKTVADWHQEKVYPAQATPEDVLAQFFEYRKEFLTRRPDFYTPIDNIHPVVAPHVERLDYKLPEATPQQTPQVPAESPATFSTNHSGMGKKEILEKYYDLLRVADSLARLKEDVPQSPERLARRLEIIEKQLAKHTTKTSEDPRLVEFGKQISEIKSRLVNGAISGEAAHAEMGQMSDAMDAHLRDAYLIETMTPSPEEVFDPHFHHAYDVMTHETLPPDSVGEVLMRGYRLGSNYQTPDGRPSTYEPARILRAPIVTPVVSSEEYAKIKEGAPNATPSTEVTPDPDIQGYLTQGTSLASSATTPAPEGPSQVSEEISPDTPSGTAEGDNTMARSLRPVPGENAGMSDLFEEPEPQAGEPEGLSPEETLRGENIAKALGRPDLTPEQAIMLLSDIYAQGYRKLSAAGETDSSVSEALESFEAEIARIEQGLPSNRQMSPLNKALIYDTAQGILDEYYPAPPEPPAKTPTSPDPTDAQVTDAALESIADPNAPASHPVATPDLGSDAPDSIYFDTPPAASVPDGAKYYYDSGLGTFFRINEAGEVSVAKGSPDAALADLTWTAPSSDPSVLTSIQNRIRTQSLKPLATPEPLEPSVDPAAEALGEMAAKEPPLDGASSPRFSRARLQNMLPFGQSIVNERQMQGQSSPLGPSPAAPPPSAASSPLDGASSPRFSRARLQNMLPFGQSIVNDLLARNASRPPGAPSAPPSGSPPPTAAAPGAPPPNGPNQVRVKYNDPLEDAIKPGGGDRPPGSPETTATGEKLPPKFGPWWIPGMMVGTSIVPEMEKGYSTGANPYGRMLGHGALTAGLLKFGHWADKTSAPLFAQMLEENRLGGRPRVNFGGVMGNQTVPSALTWKQRLGVFGNQFFQKGLNAMGTLSAAEEALSSPGITEQDARQGLVGGLIPVNARAVNALEKVGGLANLGLTATELAGLAGAGMEAAGFAAPGLMGVSAAAAPVALASGIGYAASKGIVEPLTRRYYGGQFGDVQANMGSVPNDPEQARAWTKMRLQRANEILRQNATKDARGHIQFDPTSQQRYKQFINETGSALRSKQGLGISAGAAQTFFDNAYKSSVEDQFNAYNTAKGIDRDFDAAKNEASSLFNISGSPKAWRRPTVGVGTWGSRNDSTNSLMSDSSLSRIGNEPVSPGEDNGLFHRYLGWTGLF